QRGPERSTVNRLGKSHGRRVAQSLSTVEKKVGGSAPRWRGRRDQRERQRATGPCPRWTKDRGERATVARSKRSVRASAWSRAVHGGPVGEVARASARRRAVHGGQKVGGSAPPWRGRQSQRGTERATVARSTESARQSLSTVDKRSGGALH